MTLTALPKLKMVYYNLSKTLFQPVLREKQRYLKRFYHGKSYKVLFFGSDGIALSSLRKINEFRKNENLISKLHLVTANSSKNRSVIEKYANEENIQTITWPLYNLKFGDYDIGLIVAFGHLIKDDVLNKFPLGMVNVHPSLLPRWRGAAPIIHTLLHGDKITGVSLMKIKANIFDVGEIICQKKVPVSENIRLPELTEELSNIGADMLVDCVRNLPNSLKNAQPQGEEDVTYAKKISKNISEVKWSEMTAVQVYNLYRAIYGLYPITTTFRQKQMKLFDAFLHNKEEISSSDPIGSLQYCEKTDAVKVLCKDRKYVYFKSLRIVGKRQITALDFYNGYIKNMPKEKRLCMVS